ncbi:TonB-dependent receptor [uncultured Sphingomonas sp.]|uniref:TonB-dependent receptor plug domain-containing protein n=1 Tax=uncultured Sphingomonas sp. TaxID=158754 RepID=UPI0025F2947C|nr:TonB-dependent receptor [uncultured Sphingomonas sp.]
MKNTQMMLRGGCALSAVVLAGALFAAPAMAQDTVPASADTAASGPQEIVVTGSRIPQPNLESVSPVTVVNSADLKLQGTTRVEDMLNSLPQVFAGQSSTVSNGASGAATVDLRGLGPQRTLVLINGRRLMPGDPTTSAADLNSIPDALVKRVEVLTGGASSTYGADAVAGVVNFVMDTDFTGIRLDGQYSLYQHNNSNDITPPLLDARTKAGFSGFGYPTGSVTDGGTVNATLSVGAKFDDNRGHAVAYFGYRKVDAVVQSNRDYSACTIQNASATALQCGGSSTSAPGNIVLYDGGTSTFFQIGSGRTLQPGRTRYNFAPTNYFQRPDERYTGGAFVNYEVSDALHPYLEFNFMDDRSVAQIAPSGDFGNTLTINCDNPLMSAQQKSIVCANENLVNGFLGNYPLTSVTNPGPGALTYIDPTTGQPYNKAFFQLLRRNVEGGPRSADLGHTQYRGVIGAKGALGETWNYDAYYQYGRTTYSQIYTNEFSVRKLNNALDVVNVNGKPTCRSVTTGADPNCVPYDIFGGLTTVTPAAVNYLSATGFQHGVVSEQVASASITGDLGNYGIQTPWAEKGAVVNLGVEYRREALDLKVDEAFSTGDLTGQGGATLPISGNYHVTEFFGETQVPLINKGFVYDLSFVGGYRYSHYEISNGRTFNTDTYKLGLEFAPIRSVRFRGSYNRAVRAPNLQELFSVQHVALDGSTDPCANKVLTAADKGCLAQGLSVGQRVAGNPAGQYNGLIGGNDQLLPEIATTKSFGVVFQPDFVPGLNLSVDYFDIKVRDAIQGFGADAILASCTNSLNPTACALIKRNPVSGSLWLTNDGYVQDISRNVGRVQTKGIDVNFGYNRKVTGVGDFSFTMIGTYLDSFRINNGLTESYDCAGYYGVTCSNLSGTPSAPNPKWRHKARLSYTSQAGIGASLQWRYIDPVKVDLSSNDKTLAGTYYNFGSRLGAQSYFDLALTFAPTKRYTLRLGVNNLLDREPPLVSSGAGDGSGSACPTGPCNGNTYPAVYDSLGRYIFAGATINF